MTSIIIHKERIKEHMQELEGAIAIGLEKRPSTIGLHTSACAISLLELYLHVLGKITPGTTIKHDWFKRPLLNQKISPLAERKLSIDFPDKEKILNLMYVLEEERNTLIYGKSNLSSTTQVLNAFLSLYELIKQKLKQLGEEIE